MESEADVPATPLDLKGKENTVSVFFSNVFAIEIETKYLYILGWRPIMRAANTARDI